MMINNKTPSDWVESGDRLVVNSGFVFDEHYEIDEDTGKLAPAWPPNTTKENSKLVYPYEVVLRSDAEVVSDGTDTATVEIETTAEETREVTLFAADTEVETYQIDPGQTITESITTTTTDETVEIEAVGEASFRESATIDVVQ